MIRHMIMMMCQKHEYKPEGDDTFHPQRTNTINCRPFSSVPGIEHGEREGGREGGGEEGREGERERGSECMTE